MQEAPTPLPFRVEAAHVALAAGGAVALRHARARPCPLLKRTRVPALNESDPSGGDSLLGA